MRAGVLEGNGFTRLRAIQDDVVADDPDRPGFPGYFVIPGSDVPGVSQKQRSISLRPKSVYVDGAAQSTDLPVAAFVLLSAMLFGGPLKFKEE